MTKSELIERICMERTQLSAKDVELAVKMILDHMAEALADRERIETRPQSENRRESQTGRQVRATFQAG
jgi:nucleoid DNA-binding protein